MLQRLSRHFSALLSGAPAPAHAAALPAPALPVPAPFDASAVKNQLDLSALDILTTTPAHLTRAERLLIFSLAFALRPARYLEIGTYQGGSALLVNAAFQASGNDGVILCVDPKPQIAPAHWEQLAPRTQVFAGRSPAMLPKAAADGPLDLVLIDGDHTAAGVLQDSQGILPHLCAGAYILYHDAFNADVTRGIDEFLQRHPHQVSDLGYLSRECTTQSSNAPADPTIYWGGLRLLLHRGPP